MALLIPSRLASNGKPGRVVGPTISGIDVHIDVITAVRRSSEWRRTETALEQGAAISVHRQRVPETMQLDIVVSDVQPDTLALVTGRWELKHAKKTLDRIRKAQAYDGELRVWTGKQFERTPAGAEVWVLDNIEGPVDEGAEEGVLRATLTFGESPRFATLFTPALPDVDPELENIVGDSVERGRQSTVDGGTDAAADVAGGAWP